MGLQRGEVTTTEPLVGQYLDSARRIEFTTDNLKVIEESDIIFYISFNTIIREWIL